MIATTAKPSGPSGLRTLLEAADPKNADVSTAAFLTADDKLEAHALDLARLVLTLTEEFEYLTGMLEEGQAPSGSDIANARKALAGVEALEL